MLLSHKGAGDREAAVTSKAWGNRREARVREGAGRRTATDLRAAMDSIAKRLLVGDLSTGLPQRSRETITAAA
ncbi:hypothetical protein [Streptomyces longisporus]|uniref:Integrase n=1 Tax=Streptomyces longisporus TaxID=1948 RepID=A0ABN3LR74_STRLO